MTCNSNNFVICSLIQHVFCNDIFIGNKTSTCMYMTFTKYLYLCFQEITLSIPHNNSFMFPVNLNKHLHSCVVHFLKLQTIVEWLCHISCLLFVLKLQCTCNQSFRCVNSKMVNHCIVDNINYSTISTHKCLYSSFFYAVYGIKVSNISGAFQHYDN